MSVIRKLRVKTGEIGTNTWTEEKDIGAKAENVTVANFQNNNVQTVLEGINQKADSNAENIVNINTHLNKLNGNNLLPNGDSVLLAVQQDNPDAPAQGVLGIPAITTLPTDDYKLLTVEIEVPNHTFTGIIRGNNVANDLHFSTTNYTDNTMDLTQAQLANPSLRDPQQLIKQDFYFTIIVNSNNLMSVSKGAILTTNYTANSFLWKDKLTQDDDIYLTAVRGLQ